MKFRILFVLGIVMSWPALSEPLKFKAWKEQQIMQAQNEVLRVSARLHAKPSLKSEWSTAPSDELPRLEKSAEVAPRDLKSAQDSLEIARELTLEDYTEVYLAHLQDDPAEYAKLVDSLSKDELVQLIKIIAKIHSEQTDDSSRNSSAGLALSTHS